MQTLKQQAYIMLKDKQAFGTSKDKSGGFGVSDFKIHSYSTYHEYTKEVDKFLDYLKENNVKNRADLKEQEHYVQAYLLKMVEEEKSVYSIKKARSAISMMYGHTFDIKLPVRRIENVTRSREVKEYDKHFKLDGKHKSLFDVARGTGARRADLLKLTKDNFIERDGQLFCCFYNSKGGRDRLTLVLPKYADEIRSFLSIKESGEKLFEKIHNNIDIHSYRREYCQELFHLVHNNKDIKDKLLALYPERDEDVKSSSYHCRDGQVFDRDEIYCITQCLGHNRLDVSINHYLR